MNIIATNMTFLSLAVASFVAVTPALQAHDFSLAGSLTLVGLILFFLYEKTPPSTPSAA